MDIKGSLFLLKFLNEMKRAKSWCGETHLQKCVYLYQKQGGRPPVGFEFVMYKHGPYSFDLHDQLGELESRLLVERIPTPPYGSRLELTSSGMSWLSSNHKVLGGNLETVTEISDVFAVKSVAELERLATAVWVLTSTSKLADEGKLVSHFRELKPHLSDQIALESLKAMKPFLGMVE